MVMIPPPPRGGNVQLGDFVPRAGIYTNPGVVVERKEDGNIVVDTNEEMIKKYHRHSITNGLTPDDKDRFNAIMDDIMSVDKNADRINALQFVIDDLKNDPVNRKVTESLRNEQAQLIRLSRDLPRVYNTDVGTIR